MTQASIQRIKLDDCLKLRRDILWPLLHTQDCIEPGDENAVHYGYFIDGNIISCLSVFYRTPGRRQIRKFATETEYQNKGIGTKLFTAVLHELKQEGVESVYLNARNTAAKFYERFNFTYFDQAFVKNDVTFLPMEFDLAKWNT